MKYFCNLYISKLHFDQLDIEETKEYYMKSKVLYSKIIKLLIPRIYTSNDNINFHRQTYYDSLVEMLNNCDDIIVDSPELFSEYLQFIYCYGFPLSYQGKIIKNITTSVNYRKNISMFKSYFTLFTGNTNTRQNKIKIGFISTNFFNQSVSRDRMGIYGITREVFDVTVFFILNHLMI